MPEFVERGTYDKDMNDLRKQLTKLVDVTARQSVNIDNLVETIKSKDSQCNIDMRTLRSVIDNLDNEVENRAEVVSLRFTEWEHSFSDKLKSVENVLVDRMQCLEKKFLEQKGFFKGVSALRSWLVGAVLFIVTLMNLYFAYLRLP